MVLLILPVLVELDWKHEEAANDSKKMFQGCGLED